MYKYGMSLPTEKVGQFWKAPRKLAPISKESIACLIVTEGGGSGDTPDGCGGTDDDDGISGSSTTMALSSSFVDTAVGNEGTGSEAS